MPDPLHIARRMEQIDASGIRKVFDLAAKMDNPINLSIGQPDFDVPDEVKNEAIEAIRRGHNRYTQTQGLAELRLALAKRCREEFGWPDAHDRPYLVTSGVSGALVLAMLALVDEGDEVVFPDPYFVMYAHLTRLAGGVAVPVETYDEFLPDPDRIEQAITDRTRLLILNSPCNPTGRVYPPELMRRLADVAARHDLLVISDEIYDSFSYDAPFASFAAYHNHTLLMRGFSKSHAMTGWRIGWCTGPRAVLEKMTMLQQYSFVCAPSMAQIAAVTALGVGIDEHVAAYRRKRDLVVDALSEPFGLVRPEGAFYAFVPAPGGDATAFVTRAIAGNVLIIPGNVFSTRDTHFRLSYATDDDSLRKGLDILRSLA
jgi:aspartate aminotransferase/aminotransferase